jgi:hypothetical protein
MRQYQAIPFSRQFSYLLFPILVLLLIGLQIGYFSAQHYTPNEDWSVHWSSAHLSENRIQPPSVLAADYPPLDLWIDVFGINRSITRGLSALFTVLCYALLFRMCADLFNRSVSGTAVFLLGTLTVVRYFGHLAQPYAAMLMTTTGLHLLFLRWLNRPSLGRTLLYTGFASVAIYICTYSIFLVLAQALFFILYIPWNRQRHSLILALLLAVLVVTLPRIVASTTTQVLEGLAFTSWRSIELLQMPIRILPVEFAQILLLLALALLAGWTVAGSERNDNLRLRIAARLSFVYPLAVIVVLLVINALTFITAARPLYLFALLPLLVILAARAIHALPWPAQGIILAVYVLPMIAATRGFLPGMPYQEVAERALLRSNADSRLVVAAPYLWQHFPFVRYAANLTNDDTFHLILPGQLDPVAANLPIGQIAAQHDSQSIQRFKVFIGEAAQVWLYSEKLDDDLVSSFTGELSQNYAEVSIQQQPWRQDIVSGFGELTKYVRRPDNLQNMFIFGNRLWLQAWILEQSVTIDPCQEVSVQTWWVAPQSLYEDLSMTLVLVNPDDGQGLARSDQWPAGRATSTLVAGQAYVDERQVSIPCDIHPGEYPLLIGIYQVTGEAVSGLPVTLPDGASIGDYAYLTTLFVAP